MAVLYPKGGGMVLSFLQCLVSSVQQNGEGKKKKSVAVGKGKNVLAVYNEFGQLQV